MSGPFLDPATVSVAFALMSAMLAASLFHVATHSPASDLLRLWGRSALVAAIGFALKAVEPAAAPGPLDAIGDLALGASLILQVTALSDHVRHADRIVRALVILLVAHLVLIVQFAALDPNPLVRVVGSHLVVGAALFAAATIGWRPSRPDYARLGSLMACVYGGAGLLSVALGIGRWQAQGLDGGELVGWAAMTVAVLQCAPPLALLALSHARLARQLARSATVDPLTQAANRRGLSEAWDLLQARARRGDEGWHVGVVMIDLDHFKAVNQAHGHTAGDALLQLVVEVMRNVARRYDTVSRFGGEEFCMLLPGVTIRQAQVVTERIRRRITELARERSGIDLTVSAGITVANAGQTAIEQAVDAADQMLYTAKREGRDRSRVDPDALRVIAGLTPVARSGKADELGFPLV